MTKRLTIILYGGDYDLWHGSSVRVRVVDNNGPGTAHMLFNKVLTPPTILLNLELPFDAGQAYVVAVEADDHRTAWETIWRPTFLRQEDGQEVEKPEAILRLMLVPKKAESPDLDHGFAKLQSNGSFAARVWRPDLTAYADLSPAQQMALLNVEAKLRETGIGTQRLASFVTGLRLVEPDRLYVLVKDELKQLIELSKDFAGAPGHKKAVGNGIPGHPESWKRVVAASGEVQLSFAKSPELWPAGEATAEPCFSVDVDIDLDRGLDHAKEWLHNNVFKPGQKSDQTLVYALLFSQGIRPYYTLSQLTV